MCLADNLELFISTTSSAKNDDDDDVVVVDVVFVQFGSRRRLADNHESSRSAANVSLGQ